MHFTEMLTERIISENPPPPPKEVAERKKKLRYYLSQRITSSRGALKRKGLQIPTAEEVWAVKGGRPIFWWDGGL